ncbi:MAG: trypsin-like peptidase domain-containing protein [candidate division NC10 bacterium]|nr:trypsin-like peptidase domain-containing protein [candidate division NC10 bacterium]
MKASLVHLSGSKRGKTEVFQREWLRIGSDPESDLALLERPVAPRHAEIRFENCEYLLRDLGPDGTFVNGGQISEILLQDGDLIEFGVGGPKVRFRIRPEDHVGCKPLRQILADARDMAREYGRGPLVGAGAFLRQALGEMIREYSWRLAIAALLFFLLFGGVPGILLYRSREEQRRQEQMLAQLAGEVQETGHLRQQLLETVQQRKGMEIRSGEELGTLELLQRERAQLAKALREAEAKAQASREEFQRMREALARAERRIASLEEAKGATERIIQRYAGGVAFIHGSFVLEDPSGRPLRQAGRDQEGNPLFSPTGQGETLRITYNGTAFLVSADGRLLTNRHVAEPWWEDKTVEALMTRGIRPRLEDLRAFFPGKQEASPLEVVAVSEAADVAVVQLAKSAVPLGLPVLPVESRGDGVKPGSFVLLLGYPAGLDAILAKLDRPTLQSLFTAAGDDVLSVTSEVGRRGLIRPLATQGIIGDLTPTKLVYDAVTTVGGSGGPLFNMHGKVIGINQAVLRGFGGSNFGVPIRFGLALLKDISTKR